MSLMIGTAALAGGVHRVIAPGRTRAKAEQKRAARIAAIEAGAPENYFEECRALQAYSLPQTNRKWLAVGWFYIVSGIVLLGMGLVGKPT